MAGIAGSALTDWAGITKVGFRVLCYQYGGESGSGLQAAGSPANWRCVALEKLSRVELLEGVWANRAEPFPPTNLRRGSGRGS
jgi:hypothetical protein